MTRVFLAAIAFAAFPAQADAEDVSVSLNVRPMPAPVPALKYQLLPELAELNPGNSAQNYLKCFMEQHPFFYGKQSVADRARYLAAPLAELPSQTLRAYGGHALRQADWAARLDTVDWQALPYIQQGGIEDVPRDLGPLQVLATALQVRFRAEVADRRFDDAMRTAKTLFALARHLGEHPTVIANLIGFSVAHLGLTTLEEMVQQPGCPNLYWALTDLPSPLVDFRNGMRGDRTRATAELRRLRPDAAMTDAELESIVARISGALSFAREQAGLPPQSPRALVHARAKDAERVEAARGRLVAAGSSDTVVEAFSALQVILLDDKRDYEIERDEREKLLALPRWQIDSCAALEREKQHRDGLFADLLPRVDKLRRTRELLERQIAMLRQIEALRLYAAAHDGKLPSSLANLTVPIPTDPVTGKPFLYSPDGATAHLRSGSATSEQSSTGSDIHYAVTVRK